MAKSFISCNVESGLHSAITEEAKRRKISFSDMIGEWKRDADLYNQAERVKAARIEESRQRKEYKESKKKIGVN